MDTTKRFVLVPEQIWKQSAQIDKTQEAPAKNKPKIVTNKQRSVPTKEKINKLLNLRDAQSHKFDSSNLVSYQLDEAGQPVEYTSSKILKQLEQQGLIKFNANDRFIDTFNVTYKSVSRDYLCSFLESQQPYNYRKKGKTQSKSKSQLIAALIKSNINPEEIPNLSVRNTVSEERGELFTKNISPNKSWHLSVQRTPKNRDKGPKKPGKQLWLTM